MCFRIVISELWGHNRKYLVRRTPSVLWNFNLNVRIYVKLRYAFDLMIGRRRTDKIANLPPPIPKKRQNPHCQNEKINNKILCYSIFFFFSRVLFVCNWLHWIQCSFERIDRLMMNATSAKRTFYTPSEISMLLLNLKNTLCLGMLIQLQVVRSQLCEHVV